MKAVADSSVLIALSSIRLLHVLSRRFPAGVLVPPAVWAEVVETGTGQPGAADVASASWITVREVADKAFVGLLQGQLDAGEAEAIALARQEGDAIVLLDEKDARRVAQRLSLRLLGTVGVLVWAKRAGVIANLRDHLDALDTQGRFRLSQAVRREALRAAGEDET